MSTPDPLDGFRAPDPGAPDPEDRNNTTGGDPAAETPADARTPEESAADAEARVEAAQAYKSDPRNAIYAKRTELLAREQKESDELIAAGRAAGTGLQPVTEPPAAETPETPAAVAPEGKKVKLVVYGQEREVPESEVLQAGIATLQKDAAADQKLAAAAQREQELRAHEQKLLLAAERLRQGLDPETGLPLRNAGQPPAQGAAPTAISKDKLEGAVKALYSGDTEAATTALGTLLAEITSRAGTASPVPPDIVATVEQTVLTRIDQRTRAERAEADRQEANRIFREEFSDVSADPDRLAAAKGIAQQLQSDPAWAAKGQAAIAREVGSRVRRLTAPAPVPPEREVIEQRRVVKRALAPQPQGGGRVPAPPAQQFPSNKSYIEQLRKNSGSNSAR